MGSIGAMPKSVMRSASREENSQHHGLVGGIPIDMLI
jgi:hypothetical protein